MCSTSDEINDVRVEKRPRFSVFNLYIFDISFQSEKSKLRNYRLHNDIPKDRRSQTNHTRNVNYFFYCNFPVSKSINK